MAYWHAYIRDLMARCQKMAGLAATQPSGKALHDLRVCIKRMRALWHLADADHSPSFGKRFPATRLLFKLAGKPRDKEIIASCIARLPVARALPERLYAAGCSPNAHARKMKKWLLHTQTQQHLAQEWQQLEMDVLQRPVWLTRRKYLLRRLAWQKRLAESMINETQWHEIRKGIKLFKYQADGLLGQHAPEYIAQSQQWLDRLQERLGDWHDWWLTRQWLQQRRLKTPAATHALLLQQAAIELANSRDQVWRTLRQQNHPDFHK